MTGVCWASVFDTSPAQRVDGEVAPRRAGSRSAEAASRKALLRPEWLRVLTSPLPH